MEEKDLTIFRLMTGEYIISQVIFDSGLNAYVWVDPFRIEIMFNPHGQTQINFEKLILFGKDNWVEELPAEKLLMSYDPEEEITRKYLDILQQMKAKKAGIVLTH